MIYVRQPTEGEMAELKQMTRQAVGRVSQRAQMVLLSAQRCTVPCHLSGYSGPVVFGQVGPRVFTHGGPCVFGQTGP